jgi:hypothetical protein
VNATAAPVDLTKLSDRQRQVFAELFTPSTLRHVAAAMEARDPRLVARRRLSEASLCELADMILEGRTPTIGWWRRHAC